MSPDQARDAVRQLARSTIPLIHNDDVFMRTYRGRAVAMSRETPLPQRLRMLLILVDGKRSVGVLRTGLTKYRNFEESLDMLLKMGLIERRAPDAGL